MCKVLGGGYTCLRICVFLLGVEGFLGLDR